MREEVQADDYFEILLYYPSFRVRLKSTCIARETYAGYILHGMKGSFLQQRSDLQEQWLNEGKKPSLEGWQQNYSSPDGILHTEINDKEIRETTTSSPGNYMGYYDDIYHALKGSGSNPVPAADGVKIIRIIEAAARSAKEKKLLDV
jgi:predicted dehydrogenase